MAIFLLKSPEIDTVLLVRAKCLSCARQVAVENAGDEGTAIWRNPARSTVEVIRENDRRGVILRGSING